MKALDVIMEVVQNYTEIVGKAPESNPVEVDRIDKTCREQRRVQIYNCIECYEADETILYNNLCFL